MKTRRVGLFLPPLQLVAGVARYVSGLIRGLTELDPEGWEFVIFANGADRTYELGRLPPSWEVVDTPVAAAGTGRRIVGEHLALGRLFAAHRIDLYHALNNVLPLRCPCPGVVTYHDLSFRRMPEVHTRARRLYWEACLRWARRRARGFIAVSQATADDLVTLAGIDRRRIVVAPHGCTPWPAANREVLARFDLDPRSFLLYVGTIEPRKNLGNLVSAFVALRQDGRGRELKLVLVGRKGWFVDRLLTEIAELGCRDAIILTGFVDDAGVRALLEEAAVFVYPSKFEGFGLPVLEALSCGAPTVTSDVSAMPEVVGDAALLIDPDDVGSIADAISRILTEPGLGDQLRLAGPTRAEQFTWRRTAELVIGAYDQALSAAGPTGAAS